MQKIKLTWYGRCCFLIEINGKKILTDPHDSFDGVEMGKVDADYTIISSTWHDHGHIGASPKSIILSYPGETKIDDMIITGIKTKERRGTENIIFNIKTKDYSITNFADLGDEKSMENLSTEDLKIIASTNIAFVRPNPLNPDSEISCGELALKYCNPKILIPHHYYPTEFLKRTPELDKASLCLDWVENMLGRLDYKKENIDGYELEMDINDFNEKTTLLFSDIHSQVVYER